MANDTTDGEVPKSGPATEPPTDSASGQDKADRHPDEDGDAPDDGAQDNSDDDRSASETYRRGWESLRSGGNTASASRSKVRNLIGGDYHSTKLIFDRSGDRKTSGLIRENVLVRIRATFALVAGYERMLDTVRETRVILLRGSAETGMTTTAVRLLDEVADGSVAHLALTEAITSIRGKDLTKKRGYVVRLGASGSQGSPAETELDALAELLDKRKCWCVVIDTTGADDGAPCDYIFRYHPPDNSDVLRNHVSFGLGEGNADRLDDVLRIADDDPVKHAMGPARTLADVVGLAGLLVEHAQDRLKLDEVVDGCAGLVLDQMESWFGCLRHVARLENNDQRDSLGLAAFRIALAVLNISSYRKVIKAAQQLETHMVEQIGNTTGSKTPSSGSLDQHTALTTSRARLDRGPLSYGGDAVFTGALVRYRDDRFPIAVLEHVWSHYQWLRTPMVNWLSALGQDSSIVWVRAAQVVGVLSSIDFDDAYDELIWPKVVADTTRERRFAAIALDQAAQNRRSHAIVTSYLRQWRRGGEHARWTAAATYGYGQGLDDIDATLDALRVLGTPDEYLNPLDSGPDRRGIMTTVVSRSLSSLLAFGAVEPILDTLNEWASHERTSMRTLANATILRLLKQRGYHFTYLEVSGGRDYRDQLPRHQQWPLLLALQHEDVTLVDPIARLIRTVLRSGNGNTATDALRTWITIAQRDSSCLAALVEFLPLLVHVPSDAARLIHLVTILRRDWAEPLRPDVADAVETALRSATTPEVNKWKTSTMS
jgi:hypothetical protein